MNETERYVSIFRLKTGPQLWRYFADLDSAWSVRQQLIVGLPNDQLPFLEVMEFRFLSAVLSSEEQAQIEAVAQHQPGEIPFALVFTLISLLVREYREPIIHRAD